MRLKLSPSRSSLLLAALFSAAPAFSTDLMQVYRDALTNDQQYMAARATADALREKEPQGLSGLLPTISGTANTTWNENKYSASNQPQKINRDFNTNAYNVNLTQPLFRWQNIVQYSQGKLQVVQADAGQSGDGHHSSR